MEIPLEPETERAVEPDSASTTAAQAPTKKGWRQPPNWLVPTVVIAAILSISAVGVLLLDTNGPNDVSMSFNCDSFEMPVALTIPLTRESSASIHGYDAEVTGPSIRTHVKIGTFTSEPISTPLPITITSSPSDTQWPMYTIQLGYGRAVRTSLSVANSAKLKGGDPSQSANKFTGTPLCLQLQDLTGQSPTIDVLSPKLALQPNYVSMKGSDGLLPVSDESLNVSGTAVKGLIETKFIPDHKIGNGNWSPNAIIYIDAPNKVIRNGGINLLAGQPPPGPSIAGAKKLYFDGVENVGIRIGGRQLTTTLDNQRVSMEMAVRSFTITTLLLEPPAQGSSICHFNVAGFGTVDSIEANDENGFNRLGSSFQVLPTRFEEELTTPTWSKGLGELAFVFIVFAGAIFLNRALTVLANQLMPDQKE